MHWCLAVAHVAEGRIEYYDSMGGGGRDCLAHLHKYFVDECKDKKKCDLDVDGTWTEGNLVSMGRRVPQQENGSDCGVFMNMFTTYHAQGRDWRGFAQTDMPHFRKLLCFCIATQKPPPECFLVGAGDGDDEEEVEDDDEDDDEEDSSSLECW